MEWNGIGLYYEKKNLQNSTFQLSSMGYIVPFLTISSILIDVCFTNLIFIGAIFNSYNYWYLLSYSNQFTLHYSILFLIISIIIIPLIYCYFSYYIKIIIYYKAFSLNSILFNYFSIEVFWQSLFSFSIKRPILLTFNIIMIIMNGTKWNE